METADTPGSDSDTEKTQEPVGAAALVDSSLLRRNALPEAAPQEADQAAPVTAKTGPVDEQGNPRKLTLPEAKNLKDRVVGVLKTIFDPEIPVNIYELGMVYNVGVSLEARVDVKMTLTSPACPVAGSLPGEVEAKIRTVEGVSEAKVQLVWDPPWNKGMMSDAAKLQLNLL